VRPALLLAGSLPPVCTLHFTSFAAIGAASLGVIFGALDATSLMLIAASAALGALARRWLSCFSNNPFIQPLCAALIAGILAPIAAINLHQPIATALVAFCPCMVLVPGPHLLNGAIDLARTRIALGIARLTYAGIIVLVVCFGLLLGVTASGAALPAAEPSAPVPLLADMIAAGCAVAAFGTIFSMPWRMLPFPIHSSRNARACGTLGADLARGSECRDRSARCLHSGQRYRHAGCRPPASALRRARLFRGCFDDSRVLSIPGSERSP
jgi:uncharacterized membrane protein YjjB (DUF3815 family)